MTENLRDQFALAALPQLLAEVASVEGDWKEACWDAYSVADECLKARNYGKKLNGTTPNIMVLQGEPHE